MRAYRHAYRIRGRAGRLSQTGLLDLMGQVDEKYSELHGHSTVARWESGTTNPNRERIEVFGQALNLSLAEIEGLMRLAGFDLGDAQRTVRSHRLEEPVDTAGEESAGASEDEVTEPATDLSWDDSKSYAREWLKFALSRFLLSGSFIVVAGCVLAWFGWNATWTLTLYVAFAVGLHPPAMDCAVVPQFFRQSVPLAPAAQTENDAVEHLSGVSPLAASDFGRVCLQDDRPNEFPKLVRRFPYGSQALLVVHEVPPNVLGETIRITS